MDQRFRLVQGGHTRQRAAERRPLRVSGQIVWKDARGTTRLSRVVTRDVSETGVAVESINGSPIPLYRLVYFQVDRCDRHLTGLPDALRRNAVLAAVYRVSPGADSAGIGEGYALRLLVDPQEIAPALSAVATADGTWN
jgi:hypothetical protein